MAIISLNLLRHRSYHMRHALPRLFNEAFLVHRLVLHYKDAQLPVPLTAPTKYQATHVTASPGDTDTRNPRYLRPWERTQESTRCHSGHCTVPHTDGRDGSPSLLTQWVGADTTVRIQSSIPQCCG